MTRAHRRSLRHRPEIGPTMGMGLLFGQIMDSESTQLGIHTGEQHRPLASLVREPDRSGTSIPTMVQQPLRVGRSSLAQEGTSLPPRSILLQQVIMIQPLVSRLSSTLSSALTPMDTSPPRVALLRSLPDAERVRA